MKKIIANRTVGFWAGIGATALAVVIAIAYTIHSSITYTFVPLVLVALVVGAVLEVIQAILRKFEFLVLLQAVSYGLAFALYLDERVVTVVNIFNGIVPEDPTPFFVFSAMFLICIIAACAACFMKQARAEDGKE